MPIPKNFGISKISSMHGEESRYQGRESHSSRKAAADASSLQQLSFELDGAGSTVALLQPPSFNVLFVSTPKIALLQTPQFRALAELWGETVELLKPLLRFGFPETSLQTKCPYYNDKLYETSAGALLPQDRTRTLIHGIKEGYLTQHDSASTAHGSKHGHSSKHNGAAHSKAAAAADEAAAAAAASSSSSQQQQQPSAPVGMFGISTLAFLASQVAGGMRQQGAAQQQRARGVNESEARSSVDATAFAEQHPEQRIPPNRLLVPDIPSGSFVLALNLMAYWAISRSSRRSSMGGSMTG